MLLTIPKAAKSVGVSAKTLYNWIEWGILAYHVSAKGTRKFVSEEDVQNALRKMREGERYEATR